MSLKCLEDMQTFLGCFGGSLSFGQTLPCKVCLLVQALAERGCAFWNLKSSGWFLIYLLLAECFSLEERPSDAKTKVKLPEEFCLVLNPFLFLLNSARLVVLPV